MHHTSQLLLARKNFFHFARKKSNLNLWTQEAFHSFVVFRTIFHQLFYAKNVFITFRIKQTSEINVVSISLCIIIYNEQMIQLCDPRKNYKLRKRAWNSQTPKAVVSNLLLYRIGPNPLLIEH